MIQFTIPNKIKENNSPYLYSKRLEGGEEREEEEVGEKEEEEAVGEKEEEVKEEEEAEERDRGEVVGLLSFSSVSSCISAWAVARKGGMNESETARGTSK